MAKDDSSSSLLWFVSGAAIGAVVALLYAPESGHRTRKKLVRQASRGREYLAESGREAVERGRDLYDKGREIADEAADLFERGRKLAERKVEELS